MVAPSSSSGVYLPLIWETNFCSKSAIALAYTRGHFSALASMPTSQTNEVGAWSNRSGDSRVSYLPLVDNEGRQLPLHFISEEEVHVCVCVSLQCEIVSCERRSRRKCVFLYRLGVRSDCWNSTVSVTWQERVSWRPYRMQGVLTPSLHSWWTSGWISTVAWTNAERLPPAVTMTLTASLLYMHT